MLRPALVLLVSCCCLQAMLEAGMLKIDRDDIDQAYYDNLISFDQYLQIRDEIAWAGGYIDSARAAVFPDLLTGFGAGFISAASDSTTEIRTDSTIASYNGSFEYRRYTDLSENSGVRQTMRARSHLADFDIDLELHQNSPEDIVFRRRSVRYRNHGRNIQVALGSMTAEFASGMILGRRGRVLSRSEDLNMANGFLFPDYSGGNGLLIELGGDAPRLKIVSLLDRSQVHEAQFHGISVPSMGRKVVVSAAYVRLRNRESNKYQQSGLISMSGQLIRAGSRMLYEIAGSCDGSSCAPAGCLEIRRNFAGGSLAAIAWAYSDRYAGWFSGGPSGHRYRTVTFDSLELPISDSRMGEQGVQINSHFTLSRFTNASMRATYAWRSAVDNRSDWQVIVIQNLLSNFFLSLRYQMRSTADDFGREQEERTEGNLRWMSSRASVTLTAGYRDCDNANDDWLVALRFRYEGRLGVSSLTARVDHIDFTDAKRHRGYWAFDHSAPVDDRLEVRWRFSQRVSGEKGLSSGFFRWDIIWHTM